MNKLCIGFAICGSFCTFKKAKEQIKFLCSEGNTVVPIMSSNAYSTDTRFGKACDHIAEIEDITGKKIICTITDAEPIGPNKTLDILVIEPCTGNTLAKLANGITDTPVTLAAKAHLRNNKPLLIAVSTNDALSTSAANIGRLLNSKNVFFVPMRQDDFKNKPRSVVADFERTNEAIEKAINGIQLQPVIF